MNPTSTDNDNSRRGLSLFRSGSFYHRFRSVFYGVLLVVAAVCGFLSIKAPRAAPAGENRVLARVNGEPIYKNAVDSDMPADTPADVLDDLRKVKLERFISQIEISQFLKAKKMTVSEQEIDHAVAELRKNPPSLGCPCCRYKSLDEFLQASSESMHELRENINSQIGLSKYALNLWDKKYVTKQSRDALIAETRKSLENDYLMAWQIFFNTYQQPDQTTSPAVVSERERKKAEAAWKRLQNGEPFATVAKDVSEDQMSKGNGGALNYIQKTIYGKDFAKMLSQLKPGEVSRPFQSIYGYHIIKWAPIKDADLLDISKADFMETQVGAIMEQLEKSARVIKY